MKHQKKSSKPLRERNIRFRMYEGDDILVDLSLNDVHALLSLISIGRLEGGSVDADL